MGQEATNAAKAYKERRFGDAVGHFTSAIEESPAAPLYLNRGLCYQQLGNHDLAIRDLMTAAGLKDNYAMAYLYAAKSFKAIGDVDSARDAAKRALENPALKPASQVQLLQLIEACDAETKAQLDLFIADLKLTKDGRVAICELGPAMSSSMRAFQATRGKPAKHILAEYLQQRFGLPVYVGSEPGCFPPTANHFNTSGVLESWSEPAAFDPADISTYRGVFVSNLSPVGLPERVLTHNSQGASVNALDDKLAFEKLSKRHCLGLRPFSIEVQKSSVLPALRRAEAALVSEAPFCLIKLGESTCGRGVLEIPSGQFARVMQALAKEGEFFAQDTHDSVVVESYVPSKRLKHRGQEYDPTMRIVYCVSRSKGEVTFDVIDGFWKLPPKPVKDWSVMERDRRISSIPPGKFLTTAELAKRFVPVSAKDLAHVRDTVAKGLTACHVAAWRQPVNARLKGQVSAMQAGILLNVTGVHTCYGRHTLARHFMKKGLALALSADDKAKFEMQFLFKEIQMHLLANQFDEALAVIYRRAPFVKKFIANIRANNIFQRDLVQLQPHIILFAEAAKVIGLSGDHDLFATSYRLLDAHFDATDLKSTLAYILTMIGSDRQENLLPVSLPAIAPTRVVTPVRVLLAGAVAEPEAPTAGAGAAT